MTQKGKELTVKEFSRAPNGLWKKVKGLPGRRKRERGEWRKFDGCGGHGPSGHEIT